ncbi:MAG: hypothetical protein DCC68_11705 [Planctomycetota bacterium]|nr:MAG: hypothetical protein DCC68_11705 [Planctomycetota bacterium]
MRNSINNRSRFVVFGNRQGNVVVAGRDHLRSLGDAHLLVSRLKAKSCAKRSSCTTGTSYCTPMAAAAYAAREAEATRAGIPSRQWRLQPMRRLPQPPCSRS